MEIEVERSCEDEREIDKAGYYVDTDAEDLFKFTAECMNVQDNHGLSVCNRREKRGILLTVRSSLPDRQSCPNAGG